MRTLRIFCLIAALAARAVLTPPTLAGEGANSPGGTVRLDSGLVAGYDYHFDRNAFAAGVDAPGGLVATAP